MQALDELHLFSPYIFGVMRQHGQGIDEVVEYLNIFFQDLVVVVGLRDDVL